MQIFLGKEAQTKLNLVLLALRAPLSRDQHEAFTAGRLVVKSQKFVGHHIYHGGVAITHLASKLRSELRERQKTSNEKAHAIMSLTWGEE